MVDAIAGLPALRVLIADDDRRVRGALTELLNAAGFAVIAATHDPAVAMTSAERLQPDVALVDLLLPDIDSGLALVGRLSSTVGVPVVALSAQDRLRASALAAGASAFLHKGSWPGSVLAAVRATAGARAAERTRPKTSAGDQE